MSTRTEIGKTLIYFSQRVMRKNIFENEDALNCWIDAFEGVDLDEMKSAMDALTVENKFPTIAEIKIHIYDQKHKTKTGIESFSDVWTKLNINHKPDFDDLTEATILKLGGWYSICQNWTVKDRSWYSTEFVREYDRLKLLSANGHQVAQIERRGEETPNPTPYHSKHKKPAISALESTQDVVSERHEANKKAKSLYKMDEIRGSTGGVDLNKLFSAIKKSSESGKSLQK